MPDVVLWNQGTIVLFVTLTARAREWIEENVGCQSWQWIGGSLAVDPRYADPIADAMLEAGLNLAG